MSKSILATVEMGVLRFPLSSEPTEYVLINVRPTSPDLTAKLVATEGLSPYVLNLTPRIAAQARPSKAPLSPEEWTKLLKLTLFENRKPGDIEIRADIEGESTLTLVFRKEYSGGLRQRLGSLTFEYKEDEEIELFEWCGQLAGETSELGAKVEEERSNGKKLASEIEELLKAKGEVEKEILGKCLRLINSKKDRINELEELLRSGGREVPPVDGPMEVDEEEEQQPVRKGRSKAVASKVMGKGKAVKAVKEEVQSQKKALPRRGKRAAPDLDLDPEETDYDVCLAAAGHGWEDEMDVGGDEDVETETEGESDHSLEEEAPKIRERVSLSQSQAQVRLSPPAEKRKGKAGNEEEDDEGPHVTSRSHDMGHSQSQSRKEKEAVSAPADDGGETESDDEL